MTNLLQEIAPDDGTQPEIGEEFFSLAATLSHPEVAHWELSTFDFPMPGNETLMEEKVCYVAHWFDDELDPTLGCTAMIDMTPANPLHNYAGVTLGALMVFSESPEVVVFGHENWDEKDVLLSSDEINRDVLDLFYSYIARNGGHPMPWLPKSSHSVNTSLARAFEKRLGCGIESEVDGPIICKTVDGSPGWVDVSGLKSAG